MKKSSLFVISILTAITITACGSTPGEPETSAPSQQETAAPETSEVSKASETATDKAWSAKGVFIDEKENHLILTYYSEEEGMGQFGWTVSAILENEMYGGFVDDDNGSLKGDIISYDSEGNENTKKTVTLTDEDPYIVLKTDTGETYQFTIDDTDYTQDMGEMLPMFQYQSIHAYEGCDSLLAAAYNYLTFDTDYTADIENVLIPYVNIVDVDESNSNDVLVYGDYYLWELKKDEDTLTVVSASHMPGIIHMIKLGKGEGAVYDAVSMDEGFTDDDVKELFGQYYDHYIKLTSDEEMKESGIAGNIADYVKANDLPITRYQLDTEPAKELPQSFIKVYRETADIPMYQYPDPSAKEYAVYQYILFTYSDRIDTIMTDVTIPYAYIIAVDDKNDQDILVMLKGFIAAYNLEGDQLQMQSGSEVSGAVHLMKTADGYEAFAFDEVLDGSEYQKTAKKIFGSHYDDFMNLSPDELAKAEKQVISDYVNMNGLNITSYQDMGYDPVTLD